jgi:hypothetical protein
MKMRKMSELAKMMGKSVIFYFKEHPGSDSKFSIAKDYSTNLVCVGRLLWIKLLSPYFP